MKILLITNEFPNPCQPGKAVFNLSMARSLSTQHPVRVISPIAWTDERRGSGRGISAADRSRAVDRIEVHHPRYYYTPRVGRSVYGWFYWQSIRATVRRVTQSWTPDIVCSYWAHPDGAVATRVARALGVPSLVIAAGSDVLVLTRDASRRRRVSDALRSADAVVTVSQHLRHRIIELGVDAPRVHLWRRGVDAGFRPGDRAAARERLGISTASPLLLWVGRMVPVKALDVLLSACEQLRDRGIAFQTCLVGDGPLRRALETEVSRRRLTDRVRFVGSVEHDCLPDWYRAADLMVLPSRSEGLPNVLRESLACGTPFVASDVGGIAELAEPDWLVQPGDPTALATAIERKLAAPALIEADKHTTTDAESADALVRIMKRLIANSPLLITNRQEAPHEAVSS